MIRSTSREAWAAFCTSKSICESRMKVVLTLAQHGPMTAGEIVLTTGHEGIWKRTSELEDMQLIEEQGKRKCRKTGKEAIVWALVPVIPDVIVTHLHIVRYRTLFYNGTWARWAVMIKRQGGLEKNGFFKRVFTRNVWPMFQTAQPTWPEKIFDLSVESHESVPADKYDHAKAMIFKGVEPCIIQWPYPEEP